MVDADKRLLGIITVDGIKNIFMETGVNELLLAIDIMEPPAASIAPESSISELKEILDKDNLEYLPVVTRGNELAGFIERRMLDKIISTRFMKLQKDF